MLPSISPTLTIEIRDACPDDYEGWLRLWNGYLIFYNNPIDATITASTWARILDTLNPLRLRVALHKGDRLRIVGFAIHHHHVSTWNIEPRCYLEDLFVDPDFRGQHIGRQLIDDVIARSTDCSKVYWHTEHNNTTARRLYDTFGPVDTCVRYSVPLGK